MSFSKKLFSFFKSKSIFSDLDKLSREINTPTINKLFNYKNEKIRQIIMSGEYDELLFYQEFDLSKIELRHVEDFVEKNKKSIIMKHFIDHTINLNYQFPDGCCLLHVACYLSKTDTIMYLVNKGVNLECMNHYRIRPIHLAAKFADVSVIESMDKNGINLQSQDLTGRTPFLYAKNNSTITQYFMNRGYQDDDLKYLLDDYTPLREEKIDD